MMKQQVPTGIWRRLQVNFVIEQQIAAGIWRRFQVNGRNGAAGCCRYMAQVTG